MRFQVESEDRVVQFPLTADAQRRLARARYGVTGLKGLRLTARGRVVLVAVALLLIGAGVLFGSVAQATDVPRGLEVTTHSVVPGDTLWSIAASVNPGVDNRDIVREIEELNGMSSGRILAGQVLLLPVYEK